MGCEAALRSSFLKLVKRRKTVGFLREIVVFLLSKVSKEKVAAFENDGDDDATEF